MIKKLIKLNLKQSKVSIIAMIIFIGVFLLSFIQFNELSSIMMLYISLMTTFSFIATISEKDENFVYTFPVSRLEVFKARIYTNMILLGIEFFVFAIVMLLMRAFNFKILLALIGINMLILIFLNCKKFYKKTNIEYGLIILGFIILKLNTEMIEGIIQISGVISFVILISLYKIKYKDIIKRLKLRDIKNE